MQLRGRTQCILTFTLRILVLWWGKEAITTSRGCCLEFTNSSLARWSAPRDVKCRDFRCEQSAGRGARSRGAVARRVRGSGCLDLAETQLDSQGSSFPSECPQQDTGCAPWSFNQKALLQSCEYCVHVRADRKRGRAYLIQVEATTAPA
jgi:hypothetical protein